MALWTEYFYVTFTDGGEQLFLVSRDVVDGRYRACVRLARRSPEVVQLYHVIAAADQCHADLFDESDAWLLVDVAALHEPFPVFKSSPTCKTETETETETESETSTAAVHKPFPVRPCALHGGFKCTFFRAKGISVGWRTSRRPSNLEDPH